MAVVASASLHAHINRAAFEVGVFLREISQLSKIRPPPLFGELLKFIAHVSIFEVTASLSEKNMGTRPLVVDVFFSLLYRRDLGQPTSWYALLAHLSAHVVCHVLYTIPNVHILMFLRLRPASSCHGKLGRA